MGLNCLSVYLAFLLDSSMNKSSTIYCDIINIITLLTWKIVIDRKMIVDPCSIYCIIMCGIGLIQVPPVMLPHHSAICSSKVVPVSTFFLILTQCVGDWGERFENSLNERKELQKLCMFLLSLWRIFFFGKNFEEKF